MPDPSSEVDHGGKGSFGQDLSTIYRLRSQYTRLFPFAAAVLVLSLLQAELLATAISVFQNLVARLGDPSGTTGRGTLVLRLLDWLGAHWGASPFAYLAVGGAISMVASAWLGLRIEISKSQINMKVKRSLRKKLVEAYGLEPQLDRESSGAGALAQSFRIHVDGTSTFLVFGILGFLTTTLQAVWIATQLGLNVTGAETPYLGLLILGLFVCAYTPLQILINRLTAKGEGKAYKALHDSMLRAGSHSVRFFQMFRDLLLLGGEKRYARKLAAGWESVEDDNLHAERWIGRRTNATEVIQHILLFPLLVLLIKQTGGGAGEFVAAQAYLLALTAHLAVVVSLPIAMLQHRPALNRIRELLALEDPGPPPEVCGRIRNLRAAPITVNDITYRYPRQEFDTLKGVSFEISAGDTVGLVGANGSGKSTLVRALTGELPLGSGSITVDGIDITDWHQFWRREVIALIPQKPTFGEGSFYENIDFGRNLARETVEHAAQIAGVLEIARQKGITLDSPLDPEQELSGGQQRRLALARAVAGEQPIIILDEPTANLSAEAIRETASLIRSSLRDRTCLVITHDVDLVETDFNLYLRDGRIVDKGKHTELASRSKDYADLTMRNDSGATDPQHTATESGDSSDR